MIRLVALLCLLSTASAADLAKSAALGADELSVARQFELPEKDYCERLSGACDESLRELGRALFFAKGFSRDKEVSCSTCHDPAASWGPPRNLSSRFRALPRRIPSLENVALQRWFFWDGRADSLWSQFVGPLENDREVDSHRIVLVSAVAADPRLSQLFREAFGDGDRLARAANVAAKLGDGCVGAKQCDAAWAAASQAERNEINRVVVALGIAIEAFETGIKSAPTRLDRYLAASRTDPNAQLSSYLTSPEIVGLKLFVGKARCVQCHSGPAFSDGAFHGLFLAEKGKPFAQDAGRFNAIPLLQSSEFNARSEYWPKGRPKPPTAYLVRDASLWGQFRTPSLRNVAQREAFMHGGQFESLRDVLRYYNTLENAVRPHVHEDGILVPLNLDPEELSALESFLHVLTN